MIMHEKEITQKVIDEAQEMGATEAVRVEVGELAEISPDEMQEALEKMTDWEVRVDYKESKVECECGYVGRARIVEKGHGYCIFNCPKCDRKPEVINGGDIKVIEVD